MFEVEREKVDGQIYAVGGVNKRGRGFMSIYAHLLLLRQRKLSLVILLSITKVEKGQDSVELVM